MVDIPTERALPRNVPSLSRPQARGLEPVVGAALQAFGVDVVAASNNLDAALKEERREAENAERVSPFRQSSRHQAVSESMGHARLEGGI